MSSPSDPYGALGAPYSGPGAAYPVPRPADTAWVWLLVLLPLIAVIPTFFYLEQMRVALLELVQLMPADSSRPDVGGLISFELGIIFNPWFLILTLLGWVMYGLGVWFAACDARELTTRGFVQPFHWAWMFLSVLVYVIGRHVVLRRQGGSGMKPLLVMIVMQGVILVATFAWTLVLMAQVVGALASRMPVG